MHAIPTSLPEVIILEPKVFGDDRGFFMESYNERTFSESIGVDARFLQDNHSRSMKGVLRGLHYQLKHPQGKLVRVVSGEVFDVAVDIRRSSSNFGKWAGIVLSADNKRLLWLPPGFAHGFLVLSDSADFLYKTTEYWYPEDERTIAWNDPVLGIEWPSTLQPIVSKKDASGTSFSSAEVFA
jgi:dTDP-4-dehydrorhamnose 3,5-epimerase